MVNMGETKCVGKVIIWNRVETGTGQHGCCGVYLDLILFRQDCHLCIICRCTSLYFYRTVLHKLGAVPEKVARARFNLEALTYILTV